MPLASTQPLSGRVCANDRGFYAPRCDLAGCFVKFFTSTTFNHEGRYFSLWLNGHPLYLREQNDSTDIRDGGGCRIHVNR